MTERLARVSAAHPGRIIAAWILAIVLAVVAVGALLGELTTEGTVTNDPDSERADRLLEERLTSSELVGDYYGELVIVRSERFNVDDPRFSAKLEELARAPGIEAVGRPQGSAGGQAMLLPVRASEDGIDELIDAVQAADGKDGFAVNITGDLTVDEDFNHLAESDLREGELYFGAPAALLVLVLVFGALVAAFMPLILAVVSIAIGLGLIALLSQGFELSIYAINMLTGMGLALGIDYALFVVSRFREERAAGKERLDAIAASGATASRAVLFSGTAFVLAMTGLLLVPNTIMRSLAVGAILVGIVSVAAALTLLPALLGLLGDRVNALHVPVLGRRLAESDGREGRFWGTIVRWVMRRPAVSLVAAAAVLLAAASPVLGMESGAAGISTIPDGLTSKEGFVALQRSFREAGHDPATIVIDGDVDSATVRSGIERLGVEVADNPVLGAPNVETYPDRDLAVLTVPVAGDPVGDVAVAAVRDLRAEIIPRAFEGVDAEVLVTGETAGNIDYIDVMDAWLAPVLAFVLGLSFLLLIVAFRSLVVAATAIVMNLLSVGAAYGLLVLVFQEGVGTGLLGFQQVDIIEAWVPLFLFAVLFGLSMDYQVFLLSRIRERFARTGDNTDAVSFGITSTARIITGAALIIVAVFWGFAMGDLVMFQQMGFGIGVALLIDATIVRSVLVPAAMRLLGRWNWYLPSWLQWLPHVEVEREHPPEAVAAAAASK